MNWKIEVLPGNNFEVWYLPQLGQLKVSEVKSKTLVFLPDLCTLHKEAQRTPACLDLWKNSSIMSVFTF